MTPFHSPSILWNGFFSDLWLWRRQTTFVKHTVRNYDNGILTWCHRTFGVSSHHKMAEDIYQTRSSILSFLSHSQHNTQWTNTHCFLQWNLNLGQVSWFQRCPAYWDASVRKVPSEPLKSVPSICPYITCTCTHLAVEVNDSRVPWLEARDGATPPQLHPGIGE